MTSIELTSDMKECMKAQRIFPMATASKDEVPNVVPIGMLFPGEDGKVWIIDNFMNKTLENIKENPVVSFYIWSPEFKQGCWQVKGNAEIVSSGADHDKAVTIAHSMMETAPAKNLIKVAITDIYTVAPGPDAGKKIA